MGAAQRGCEQSENSCGVVSAGMFCRVRVWPGRRGTNGQEASLTGCWAGAAGGEARGRREFLRVERSGIIGLRIRHRGQTAEKSSSLRREQEYQSRAIPGGYD